jgi:NAD(P)-dependent dehydrogenase (short-subunit alcohol dehydrogenase family)
MMAGVNTSTVGPVLITGCSSGIGQATALRLVSAGHLVYATARRPDTLADLVAAGCRGLPLDVTDDASMTSAVDAVQAEHSRVGALVNNAGYGEYGPIEEVELDAARRQFETNVFGPARLTQLVLPGMRAAGTGRIVNVSSMGGRVVLPIGGYYHASKWAVEAISDALRYETEPFGIRTVIVEPGLIRTRFSESVTRTSAAASGADSPYAALVAANQRMTESGYRSRFTSVDAGRVAAVIEKALTGARPRARYVITPTARLFIHVRRLLGARAFEQLIRRSYPT